MGALASCANTVGRRVSAAAIPVAVDVRKSRRLGITTSTAHEPLGDWRERVMLRPWRHNGKLLKEQLLKARFPVALRTSFYNRITFLAHFASYF